VKLDVKGTIAADKVGAVSINGWDERTFGGALKLGAIYLYTAPFRRCFWIDLWHIPQPHMFAVALKMQSGQMRGPLVPRTPP
jgi:hypothetical protein